MVPPRGALYDAVMASSWSCSKILVGLSAAGCLGCQPARVCTEKGCPDAATITAKLSAAGAPLGAHTFEISVDDAPCRCTVEFTSLESTAQGECTVPGLSLRLGPRMRGVEETRQIGGQGVVMHTEVPVAGEFEWSISFAGHPKSVRVVHSHGGKTLVQQTADLVYSETRPNGEGCEPVCKRAAVEWKGP